MKKLIFIFALFLLGITYNSCIGEDTLDDEIPERVQISNRPLQNIAVSETHQFDFRFFNNIGIEDDDVNSITWSSSNVNVATIDNSGLLTAVGGGSTTIAAEVIEGGAIIAEASTEVTIVEDTPTPDPIDDESETEDDDDTPGTVTPNEEPPAPFLRSGSGSFTGANGYVARGDFTISEVANSNNLEISIASNFVLADFLPGPYVYLSNNPNSINGAREISRVTTFRGAHTITVQAVDIEDFAYVLFWCKPFGAKIGAGRINN
jgi:hypothetical protein